jgi:hypothetical protein
MGKRVSADRNRMRSKFRKPHPSTSSMTEHEKIGRKPPGKSTSIITTGQTSNSTKFQPSQNWAILQKRIQAPSSSPAPIPSKKRKRNEINEKTDQPKKLKPQTTNYQKLKIQKPKPSLTTYNPWHPHESSRQSQGNPLLILESTDKTIKSSPLSPGLRSPSFLCQSH